MNKPLLSCLVFGALCRGYLAAQEANSGLDLQREH